MENDHNQNITLGDYSIYIENGNVTIIYPNGKKILKHLGIPPSDPELFLGRGEDLKNVHDQLFAGNNLLLLVNGEGGIGKTTLAAKYYHTHADEYTHTAWVFAENSIRDALLTLATALHLDLKNMTDDERLHELLRALADLKKPCLLVIDNANTLDDLAAHYKALRCCTNFHVLLTTRITKFSQAKVYPIHAFNDAIAIKLFTIYYEQYNPTEDELLKEIFRAIGYNTLVIELLAKNLANINSFEADYSLNTLLQDLQKRGVLSLSKSEKIQTSYKSVGFSLREEKPEKVIAAMYNLSELSIAEKALLTVFAVLPAESLSLTTLKDLLPNLETQQSSLEKLITKGWIGFSDESKTKTYKCSPVIQEVTRQQNSGRMLDDCKLMINTIAEKLQTEPSSYHLMNISYEQGEIFARYGETIINNISLPQHEETIAKLSTQIGNYYMATGNIEKAQSLYDKSSLINEKLDNISLNKSVQKSEIINQKSNNSIFFKIKNIFKEKTNKNFTDQQSRNEVDINRKHELSRSYQNKGNAFLESKKFNEALRNYKLSFEITKQLYQQYPKNIELKRSHAISFLKLGLINNELDNDNEALTCYNNFSQLSEELVKSSPYYILFKTDLSLAYEKLGNTYSKLGNKKIALDYYKKHLALKEEIYNTNPNDVEVKTGLAISYYKRLFAYFSGSGVVEAFANVILS